jgi:hypothetical protein
MDKVLAGVLVKKRKNYLSYIEANLGLQVLVSKMTMKEIATIPVRKE